MLISAIFYYYVQGMWVDTGKAPIVLRYLDWILTHSMQVVLFYVILTAVTKVSSALFWRLLIGTLVMVIGEFLGTAGYMSATLGFIIGMAGWIYIIFEIFKGESSVIASKSDSVKKAFRYLALIVVIGWSIYPLGYIFGLLSPMIGLGTVNINFLNVTYNLADFINKILFGLIIWNLAREDSKI